MTNYDIINKLIIYFSSLSSTLQVDILKTTITTSVALVVAGIPIYTYILNKQKELAFKRYEMREKKYSAFFEQFSSILNISIKDSNIDIKKEREAYKEIICNIRKTNIDMVLYASKNVVKKITNFNEFKTLQELINKQQKTEDKFKEEYIIFFVAEILGAMRQEIGFERKNISPLDCLRPFVNNIITDEQIELYHEYIFFKSTILFLNRLKIKSKLLVSKVLSIAKSVIAIIFYIIFKLLKEIVNIITFKYFRLIIHKIKVYLSITN